MIIFRGKRANGHGAAIDRMVKLLQQDHPTKEAVQLWFRDDESVPHLFTFEYGTYTPSPEPTIVVATRNRTPNQIAGIIAQQYAKHLQKVNGQPEDLELATEFAKEMNKKTIAELDLQHFHPEKEK